MAGTAPEVRTRPARQPQPYGWRQSATPITAGVIGMLAVRHVSRRQTGPQRG